MMNPLGDLPLFANRYPAYPGAQRRDTSEEAAARIKPHVANLREQVFAFIKATGGATDEEIQLGLELGPNTARPRRCELYQLGLVKDSGERRKTSSGRLAAVWVAT